MISVLCDECDECDIDQPRACVIIPVCQWNSKFWLYCEENNFVRMADVVCQSLYWKFIENVGQSMHVKIECHDVSRSEMPCLWWDVMESSCIKRASFCPRDVKWSVCECMSAICECQTTCCYLTLSASQNAWIVMKPLFVRLKLWGPWPGAGYDVPGALWVYMDYIVYVWQSHYTKY